MEKNKFEKIQEELFYENKNAVEGIKKTELKKVNDFCEGYKTFLNLCKTERECVEFAEKIAVENGYKNLNDVKSLKAGDKVYVINRNRAILLCVIGKEDIDKGVNIVTAHIDSPRLDLKPNPLFEMNDIAYFKTHYYGGIKKYQWLAMPLAIHGIIVKENGEKVKIVIGEEETDPVFCVTDLLPHLANSQLSKKGNEFVEGEKLNVVLGTIPVDGDVKEKVKLAVMILINEKYGIKEKDFMSAEIEVVPAYKARDIGFDRSLIGSYGQDDRVCAYTAFKGIMDTENPNKTSVCYLVDKEEIGSCDSTGAMSYFFEDTLAKICSLTSNKYNNLYLRKTIENSECLSADVSAAFDPNFPEVCEKYNTAYLNRGLAVMKYSGARGKAGSNEATCEFTRKVLDLFNNNKVNWQMGELGKVDEGGGGTVAQYFAVKNISVIDCGVPLLCMHSPFEISAKSDVYNAYKGYKSFLKK